jgi:outer membrane receptor for monomeric catechols
MLGEASRYAEIGLNMTRDKELKQALSMAADSCTKQSSDVTDVFKAEGVSLPTLSSPKPQGDPNGVPPTVALTDEEIANGLIAKTIAAMIFDTTALTQSVRMDIGRMWAKFLFEWLEFHTFLCGVLKKRGWMKIPPYYQTPTPQ